MTRIFGSTTAILSNSTAIAAEVTTLAQTTTSLAQYASVDLNFTTSKTGILASFTADRSCLIRVYSTNANRSADSRAYNTSVPAAGVTGLIAEVEIDTAVINNVVTNVIYANADSPQVGTLYFKVFNLGSVGAINLSLGISQFQPIIPITSFPLGGFVESPVVKELPLFVANTSYIINSIVVKTSSGSCVLSVQIDGVSITGMNSISATSTKQTFTATGLNITANNSRLAIVVSSVTSAVGLEFTLNIAGV